MSHFSVWSFSRLLVGGVLDFIALILCSCAWGVRPPFVRCAFLCHPMLHSLRLLALPCNVIAANGFDYWCAPVPNHLIGHWSNTLAVQNRPARFKFLFLSVSYVSRVQLQGQVEMRITLFALVDALYLETGVYRQRIHPNSLAPQLDCYIIILLGLIDRFLCIGQRVGMTAFNLALFHCLMVGCSLFQSVTVILDALRH